MSFFSGLFIISSLAAIFWLVFLLIIRGICYFGPNTDNKFLARSAAQSSRWKWLSDLHKMALTKTGMMEMTILGIALFQKIFRNKTGDYPYVAWGGFTAALSAVLIYLIGTSYWNPAIGLILAFLLLSSFWLWQIALYGGHANTAAVFALLSIYLIQHTNQGTFSPLIWLLLGGVTYGLTQFSSRSASKYTPLFLSAVFYERYVQTGFSISTRFLAVELLILLLAVLLFLFVKLTYKKMVTAIYFKKAPAFFNKIIAAQDKFSLQYYLDHAKNKINYYLSWATESLIFLMAIVSLLGWPYFWPVLIGALSFLFIFTLPDIKSNFKYFLNIVVDTQVKKKSHFRLYVNYFAKKGITVSRDTQGGGWRWIPKIFFRMAPWQTIFFLLALAGLILTAFRHQTNPVQVAFLITASLSPILWAQFTRAPQISRTFSPGLISMLLVFGYTLSKIKINLEILALAGLLPALIWNLWKFFSDIYPARMTAANLTKFLLSLKINEIYTYNTEYNNNVINAIDPNILKNIKINYIQNINEVKEGWIVIPGTSSKAMHMSSEQESVREGDYTKDHMLNKLIKSRQIEKVATAKFKALGTSNIWVHESEVASYRDLILKEVKNQDRFRGYAWLIHSSRLP